MTNLEWVLNEGIMDEGNRLCALAYYAKYGVYCRDKDCSDCCFFENEEECLKELLKEHKRTIKLKQWEYDVLKAIKVSNQSAYRLDDSSVLKELVNKGFFKGIDDTKYNIKSAVIDDVLDNCEIVPN